MNRLPRRRVLAACASLVLIATGVSLTACGELPDTASHYEPYELEPIEGTDVQRVRFTAEGVKRVGLQTAVVRESGGDKIVPYAAVVYDAQGNTFAYTNPEPLTFVRQEIEIDQVNGDKAVLSDGPPAGTDVVTVGAAEVYGTEFEVAH